VLKDGQLTRNTRGFWRLEEVGRRRIFRRLSRYSRGSAGARQAVEQNQTDYASCQSPENANDHQPKCSSPLAMGFGSCFHDFRSGTTNLARPHARKLRIFSKKSAPRCIQADNSPHLRVSLRLRNNRSPNSARARGRPVTLACGAMIAPGQLACAAHPVGACRFVAACGAPSIGFTTRTIIAQSPPSPMRASVRARPTPDNNPLAISLEGDNPQLLSPRPSASEKTAAAGWWGAE
jgi:hypothetical protein